MTTAVKTPDGREFINLPEGSAPMPLGAYSHAVRAGDFIYLCGLGARDPKLGREVGVEWDANGNVVAYDIAIQTHAVMKNMILVLKEAGCTLENLIDVQVFLADMKDFMAYNQVYGTYFNFANLPARTTIEAKPPGANFIEIKAIAYQPR